MKLETLNWTVIDAKYDYLLSVPWYENEGDVLRIVSYGPTS